MASSFVLIHKFKHVCGVCLVHTYIHVSFGLIALSDSWPTGIIYQLCKRSSAHNLLHCTNSYKVETHILASTVVKSASIKHMCVLYDTDRYTGNLKEIKSNIYFFPRYFHNRVSIELASFNFRVVKSNSIYARNFLTFVYWNIKVYTYMRHNSFIIYLSTILQKI